MGGYRLALRKLDFNHCCSVKSIKTLLKPVGDIHTLTDVNLEMHKMAWRYDGIHDIDLVCGGPPCQGFSGIGHRRTFNLAKKDIPSNHLFEEMVRVVRCVRPKMFLFENVRGLLYSRWTQGGEKGEIFKAVLKAFKSLGDYSVRWICFMRKTIVFPKIAPVSLW